MKILSIGSDRDLFNVDSAVLSRVKEQAALVTEMHVVVFTPRGEKFKKIHVDKHLTIYPTSSVGKWAYLPDAFRIAKAIIPRASREHHASRWLITTQDPFETGALGFLLGKILHVPLHLQIHTDPWSDAWKKERKLNFLRFAVMRFLLRGAAGIRVVSKRVHESVLHEGVDPACVTQVPIFTDVKAWKKEKPSFDLHQSYRLFRKIILSMGRLQPEKNFHGLIRAFARVRKIHDDALLIIVGAGPERERLQLLASSLGLHDAVVVLPWARNVVSYYKTCDLYVQPSRYEGWGLAVVEAMASGTPVLMTDVGVAGELVRDKETGLVVPVGDEEALADGIVHLLANDALRKSLAKAALHEVLHLPSHDETLALYKESWENVLEYYGNQKTKQDNK